MYTETFAQFKKRLGQLDKWLGAAADYAKSKNLDPDVFPTCASLDRLIGRGIQTGASLDRERRSRSAHNAGNVLINGMSFSRDTGSNIRRHCSAMPRQSLSAANCSSR